MPGALTEVTEITTALGMLATDLDAAFADRPCELRNLPDGVWERLACAFRGGEYPGAFEAAFANGRAFLHADDGLRGRGPRLVEWKGPHRPPGDDVIPADLRVDHAYLVSCKYLSKIVSNAGPSRLFDRLLSGDERSSTDWFATIAPAPYQAFYDAAVSSLGLCGLPASVDGLGAEHRAVLKAGLRSRVLPPACRDSWSALCEEVAARSAARWNAVLGSRRVKLRMLWRLLRIGSATYYVLGADRAASLRLRVASQWDWMQDFELRDLVVEPRRAGQPEIAWTAEVRGHGDATMRHVHGHVEIRWSHGRFSGFPEAKVYLDTPHVDVPGYFPLR